jgi:hypothetical protein
MEYFYVVAGLQEGAVDVLSFRERLWVGKHIVSSETHKEYRVIECREALTQAEAEMLVSDGGLNLWVERV